MAARVVEIAFIGSTAQLEAALARAGISADVTSKGIADSFNRGTSAAGGAITNLAKKGESLGLPMSNSLAKVGTALDQATSKTNKLTTVFSALGKTALVGGLAAFAVAVFEGVKGAAALQQQMELLKTQAGASQTQVNTLTKDILNMASSVGTSPQTLAEGMYHVVSSLNATIPATKRVSTEMAVLKVAAEGAKVGNANLTDVTNALDAAVVSGIGGVQNYQQAMGALNATVGAGDMTMQDLADALGTGLLAPAKTFGLQIKDVGAALAVFGDNNIRGSDAATKLRQAIVTMGAPSAAASASLAAIGLTQTQLADDMRSPKGLVGALSDLKTHLAASGADASQQALILSRAFGGGKTATAVMLLLDQLDRLKAKETAVGQGASGFGAAWTTTTHNLAFQWSQITAGAAAFADKLGGYLLPRIQQLGNFVAHNKTAFEDLAKAITVVLGGAIAVFVGEKVVAFVGGIAKMVTAIEGFLLKQATMSAQTTLADGTIIAENDAASASFGRLAGAITAAGSAMADFLGPAAAAVGIYLVLDKIKGQQNNIALQNLPLGVGNALLKKDPSLLATGAVPSSAGSATAHTQNTSAYLHTLQQQGSETITKLSKPTTTHTTSGGGGGATTTHPALTGALAGYLGTQSGQVALQKAELQLSRLGQQASQVAAWGPTQVGARELGGLQRAGIGVTGLYGQAATVGRIRAATTPGAEAQAAGLAGAFNASNNPTLVKMAQSIESSWLNLTNKLANIISSDTKAGQSELTKLQSAQNSTSFSSLKDAVTGAAMTNFNQMVKDLDAIHTKGMLSLASQLKSAMAAAQAAYQSVLATLATTAQADSQELLAQQKTAQTTAATNAAQGATGVAGLQGTQASDRLSAAATAIQDAAKLQADAVAQQVAAIQVQTTMMQDTANAQILAIQDQTQTQVDTLGERGLYGLNLQAQMAKVALDQTKATDDAAIAAAQAHLDQVNAQTNAAVLVAQTNLDRVTQQTDAAEATAQATADSVAINNAITLAAAQATADSVAVTTAINNAAAQAHTDQMMFGNIQQQDTAQAAQKLTQGQSDLANANAQATLAQTTATVNASNQNAQNAYSLTQAYASQQQAVAAAQLAAMQNAASTQQALAQQQLTAIQTTSAIAEAKQQAQVNLLTELAQVQFAGSGTTVYITGIPENNAAAMGAAVSYALRYKVA